MYEYACEFELTIDREIKFCPYDATVGNFACENPKLYDWIEFSSDFCFEHPEIKKLESGIYFVYVRGIAEFESDVDWESGIEEGHFLLGIDKLKIEYIGDLDEQTSV